MAITSGVTNQFKLDCLDGVHAPGDTYKCALYTDVATLGPSTTQYTVTDEVSGTGYTAGGATLSGRAASLDGSVAMLDFTDPSWTNATITARGCMIYNSSKSNKAIAVYDFGGNASITGGTFTVNFPTAAAASALVRIE